MKLIRNRFVTAVFAICAFGAVTHADSEPGIAVCWGQTADGNHNPPQVMLKNLDAGDRMYFGIDLQGAMHSWGTITESWFPPAVTIGPFLAVSTGSGQNVIALRTNRTITAWATSNQYGILNVPTGNSFVQISSGQDHAAGLTSEGLIVSWGTTQVGWNNDNPSAVPSGGPFSSVACGSWNIYAIRTNGTIAAAGYSGDGQLSGIPTENDFVKVVGGWGHGLGLRSNGEIRTWGRNGDGERNLPSGLYRDIDAGGVNSIGLLLNGNVVVRGRDEYGLLTVPAIDGVTSVTISGANAGALAPPPAIILGVVPVSGASIGGTAVRINGNNFPISPTVTFGGAPATDIVVVSPTLITAVTPAGTPGMTVVAINSTSSESFYYRPSCGSDLDNNGVVDSADLGIVLGDFGNCYESLATPQEQEPFILQSVETAIPVLNKK